MEVGAQQQVNTRNFGFNTLKILMKGQQQHLKASFDYDPDNNAAKINLYKN